MVLVLMSLVFGAVGLGALFMAWTTFRHGGGQLHDLDGIQKFRGGGCRAIVSALAFTSFGLGALFAAGLLGRDALKPGEPEVEECFVLHDLVLEETSTWGAEVCDVPSSPASTFKIPHALIGLQTGVIESPDAVRPFDPAAHPDAGWGREDQTLTTAIRQSVLWYFQEVAAAVGRERMSTFLADYQYGNGQIGDDLTTFWLDGSLRVTAHEQLEFLLRLATGELPASAEHVTAVRTILRQPVGALEARVRDRDAFAEVLASGATFEFKTGAAAHGDGSVTWLVGRIQHPGTDHVFVSRVFADTPPGSDNPAVESAFRRLVEQNLL